MFTEVNDEVGTLGGRNFQRIQRNRRREQPLIRPDLVKRRGIGRRFIHE